MLKNKNKQLEKENDDIKIKEEKSSLTEFVKRSLPTEKEVKEFEEKLQEEAHEEDVEESLMEIYQDDKGDMVDVKKLEIKKRRGLLFWFFSFIFPLIILAGLAYGGYYYITNMNLGSSTIELSIEAPDKIVSGEEFFYTINFKNLSKVNVNNIEIELSYPDNFIFLSSSPEVEEKIASWDMGTLASYGSDSIKIKGKIIDEKDETAVMLAKINYMPENFSSEFQDETSHAILIEDIGYSFDFDYPSLSLIGEENEIEIEIKKQTDNFLPEFSLTASLLENMEIVPYSPNIDESNIDFEYLDEGMWKIISIGDTEEKDNIFKIKYKINEKIDDEQEISLVFQKKTESGEEYTFYEKNITVEVMKSDLNVNLIINGSKNDSAVDFGQTLNYSISYANKGEVDIANLAIMAVLESDFLDWTTLSDAKNGEEKGNTITWTKEQIPALENVAQNEEGVIDFSINTMEFRESDLGKDFNIKSYVQYIIGGSDEDEETEDTEETSENYSNTIINEINSDLSLIEEVRYFNEDNIPVGSGPLPPRVDESTTFKVYWTLSNNLHELQNASVEVELPDYVEWADKGRTSVGSIGYDSDEHKIVWNIGRLPISVYKADAEFSISITPTADDIDKIMIILPGSIIQATDNETGNTINKITSAKTTKLEDDEVASANNDGRVVEGF